ncbi:MAG TPA: MATE family efflux transporter, partial [Magnetospirillaceae bacterium]
MHPDPAPPTHRRVLSLALPIIAANLTQPLLSIVDAAIAGHLPSAASLGGVALGGLFFNTVYWGFGFLRMATTGLVAQAHGAGDGVALRATVLRALALAVAIGLALIVVKAPLVTGALNLLGGSPEVVAAGHIYCSIRLWAAPMALANYVVLGTMLGQQRAKTAMLIQVTINVTNMIAAFAFVYGLDWGVGGLAGATALADAVGLILGAAILWRTRPRGLAPLIVAQLWERTAVVRLLLVNRDVFLRTLCLLACFAWFTHEGAQQGDAILAGNALLMNLQTFMAFVLDGFAQAAEALVGAAIGAGGRQAYRAAVRISTLWAGISALIFTAFYALIGPLIIAGLTDHASIRDAALTYLPWAAVSPILSVWSFQLDGVFIGATRTRDLRNSMAI